MQRAITVYCSYTVIFTLTPPLIEEGFIKKPRQTVGVAFWGKMATHMLLLGLCSRQIVKKRAGSKLWGDICILHIL